MPRRSITVRLTLLFASVSTTVLLVLGLLVASLVDRHFEELDTELLWSEFERIANALAMAHSAQELDELPRHHPESLIGNHGMAALIIGPDGRQLYASANARFPDSLRTDTRAKSRRPIRWTGPDNREYRGIASEARTGVGGAGPAVVAVSTDLAHHERFMASFRSTLWLVVAAAATLSTLFGWVAVRRGLAPLRTIRQRAAAVTANHLDQRLSPESFPEELAEVAQTLNEMLARLEKSFRRLSDFSADLAHELRTPVSNLLTQTQVTLSKARSEEEYRDVLASNVEEFERLSRTIEDMLFLAKSDNNLLVPNRERVDLRAEATRVLEFYEAVAEEQGIRLTCTGHGVVSGDKLMLRRAISNLVSNAVRHTPAGGTIAIRIDSSVASALTLSVENTGESIAPEHLPRLFDRFYRADSARRHFGEGAGLGLAITRSVARAHGGDASVRSARGVTTFDLLLPA
jgi:two-component system heavy metal sensor histidine kinase CusS